MTERCALYRLFDASGDLLYVGVADRPKRRLANHAAVKAWWPQVARHTLTWFSTRSEALDAESNAIRDESPRYNIAGRPDGPIARAQRQGAVVAQAMQAMKANLRERVDAAREDGQHTVIERYGRPAAVLVPVAWYISKGGDPREPLPDIADAAEAAAES